MLVRHAMIVFDGGDCIEWMGCGRDVMGLITNGQHTHLQHHFFLLFFNDIIIHERQSTRSSFELLLYRFYRDWRTESFHDDCSITGMTAVNRR